MKKFLFMFFLLFSIILNAQNEKIKVYIDNLPCDYDYIKTNITYVDYVTTYKNADVHIIFHKERLANDGKIYTVQFKGQNRFEGKTQTLQFTKLPSDSDNVIRKKTKKILELGLAYFISFTSDFEKISFNYSLPKKKVIAKSKKVGWIYNFRINSSINGSDKKYFANSWSNFNMKKITKTDKAILGLSFSYNISRYDFGSYSYETDSYNVSLKFSRIFAINNHFSWAIFNFAQHSTYENKDLLLSSEFALEYNYFPYNESSEHELRFNFFINPQYNDYIHKTIFNKTVEFLWKNGISISYDFYKDWGSNTTSFYANHFIHDTALNKFGLYNSTHINLAGGFSINLNVSVERTHDQVYISSEGMSTEDIIANKSAILTDYSYWSYIGLSYTFGAIYNNIVNTRFGG